MAFPSVTIVIPSYQRRDHLRRLLLGLGEQLGASEELRDALDIVVVLDGSTDGSKEMLDDLRLPVPLVIRALAHRGLAATRNAGIDAATGEFIWFLDDDLVPTDGLIARHRRAHASFGNEILLGATPIPYGIPVVDELRSGWERHYRQLAHWEIVESFEYVAFANTSGPALVFRQNGGFDEIFTGYGFEDWDLGVRLIERGVRIRYDGEAIALHHADTVDTEIMRSRSRDDGRGLVKFSVKHPAVGGQLADSWASARGMRLLGAVHLGSSRSLGWTSAMASHAARLCRPWAGENAAALLRSFSRSAAIAAGVADEDAERVILPRLLHRRSRGRHLSTSRRSR